MPTMTASPANQSTPKGRPYQSNNPIVRAPRQAAFTMTKVPRLDGTSSWEQYKQVFDAIVRSNGWDNMIQRCCRCSHIWRGMQVRNNQYRQTTPTKRIQRHNTRQGNTQEHRREVTQSLAWHRVKNSRSGHALYTQS